MHENSTDSFALYNRMYLYRLLCTGPEGTQFRDGRTRFAPKLVKRYPRYANRIPKPVETDYFPNHTRTHRHTPELVSAYGADQIQGSPVGCAGMWISPSILTYETCMWFDKWTI